MALIGPEGKEQLRLITKYGGIGFEIGLFIAIGYFGGTWLDDKFGTKPWLMYVGLGIGILGAINNLVRMIKKTDFNKL